MLRRPPRSTRTDTLFPTRRSSDLLKAGKLESVSLERERLKLQPMPPVTPPEAEALDRTLAALLPRVRIPALLLEVEERTDRKRVVSGTNVSVSVDLGGSRIIKNKNLLHQLSHIESTYPTTL